VRLHRHCPCNGVYLCHTCHVWVHQHPASARDLGLILSAEERAPFDVPLLTFGGWRYHDCAGQYQWVQHEPDPDTTATTLRRNGEPS